MDVAQKLQLKALEHKEKFNFGKCIELLEKSAKMGNYDAYHELADVYTFSLRDGNKALSTYRKSIMRKHKVSESYFSIGRIFYVGMNGVDKNEEEAFKSFERGKNGDCLYMSGKMLMEGRGTKENPKEAIKLYMKASKCGNEKAMNSLSKAYKDGMGVTKNPKLADEWKRRYKRKKKKIEEEKEKERKERETTQIAAPPPPPPPKDNVSKSKGRSRKKKTSRKLTVKRKKKKKKKKVKKEEELDLTPGNVVFIRISGFDPWPSYIIDLENVNEEEELDLSEILDLSGKCDVLAKYFAHPDYAWIDSKEPSNNEQEVYPFIIDDFPDFNNESDPDLQQAIEDAMRYIEENGLDVPRKEKKRPKKKRRKKVKVQKRRKKKKKRPAKEKKKKLIIDDEMDDDNEEEEADIILPENTKRVKMEDEEKKEVKEVKEEKEVRSDNVNAKNEKRIPKRAGNKDEKKKKEKKKKKRGKEKQRSVKKKRESKYVVDDNVRKLWQRADEQRYAIERKGRILSDEYFHDEGYIYPYRYKILLNYENTRFSCSVERSERRTHPVFKITTYEESLIPRSSFRSSSITKSWENVTSHDLPEDVRSLFRFDDPKLCKYENAMTYCTKNRNVEKLLENERIRKEKVRHDMLREDEERRRREREERRQEDRRVREREEERKRVDETQLKRKEDRKREDERKREDNSRREVERGREDERKREEERRREDLKKRDGERRDRPLKRDDRRPIDSDRRRRDNDRKRYDDRNPSRSGSSKDRPKRIVTSTKPENYHYHYHYHNHDKKNGSGGHSKNGSKSRGRSDRNLGRRSSNEGRGNSGSSSSSSSTINPPPPQENGRRSVKRNYSQAFDRPVESGRDSKRRRRF